MSFAEQKIGLLKIIADADEELVNKMLREIIAYYTENPDAIPDKLLEAMSEQSQRHFNSESRSQIWEEVKQRIDSKLSHKDSLSK